MMQGEVTAGFARSWGLSGTGTLPVGVQGRSALPVGDMGCRSLNRSIAGLVRQ